MSLFRFLARPLSQFHSGSAAGGIASKAGLLCCASVGTDADTSPSGRSSEAALEHAFSDFAAALLETAQLVRDDPAYDSDRHRAAGALYWAQMLLRTIEDDLLQDPDFPFFRVVDQRIREGADNPDQRYLFSPIRGGARYRIWGGRQGERRLEFQLYAGLPWTAAGGRIVGIITDEALAVAQDGSFEITLGGEPQESNWLPNPEDATMVMVRQIHSDWAEEVGHVHIDRIGYEGKLKPPPTETAIAERFERAAASLRDVVPLWPRFGRERYARVEPNSLTPPWDPSGEGGVKGRWMSLGDFELAADEALILTTWPAPGNYQGIQLTDVWTSSLEYANRQTSLTADQARLDGDGAYRFVIAHHDPAVQNWLDTTGLRRGFILLRYDGTGGEAIPEAHWPRLERVGFDEIAERLPPDTPHYTEAERYKAIERRRRHVQRRFGI
ncbi:MAG: hypothetical protein CL908_11760 [Deltaproteobacteria bacterium]|nr:hypothetical protein [Deltaproteobacteria bacterium]